MKIFYLLAVVLMIQILGSCPWPINENALQANNLFGGTEPQVRVQILHTLDKIDVQFLGKWQAAQPGSDEKFLFDSLRIVQIKQDGQKINLSSATGQNVLEFDSLTFSALKKGTELKISDVPYGIGWWWAGTEDRRYEGKVSVYPGENGNLEVVLSLLLEDYLCGVIPYEMGGDSPIEALKAQAVVARSEAVMALTSNLYAGPHYDLTSDVECQVFSGNHKRTAISDRAVTETRGIILTEKGKPINAYYASNCGGHSELIQNVWPERKAFETYKTALQDNETHTNLDLSQDKEVRAWIGSSPQVYCNPTLNVKLPSWSQKNFRWQRNYTADSLSKMISAGRNLGQLTNIEVLKRGLSGRAYLTSFDFEKKSIEVRGELNIRQMWQPPLRSSCFVVDKKDDQFKISGAGWGHGVGMCQSGAVAQALQGRSFTRIIKHYYPRAHIKPLY